MHPKYSRILLKLSGEQLAGKFDGGIDAEVVNYLVREVRKVAELGVQVVIVVGGGNFVRGAQIEGHGIKRVTGDHMGMLATMINALALTDIFEHQGIPTRCLSNIFAEQVAEPFVFRLAEKHLQNGRVIILAGGTGRPFMTTDTAAVALALELDCQIVLKATKVDGVYDKDPAQHKDAHLVSHLSLQEAVEDGAIKVMDKAAIGLALEHRLPIIVLNAFKEDTIKAAIVGEPIGTLIEG